MSYSAIQKIELPDSVAATCVTNYTSSKVQGFVALGYIAPVSLTFDEWLAAGEAIKKIDKFRNFAKGDWLIAGERKFGEMYSQALDDEWGSYDKLRKLVWVARNVSLENRRDDLTWTHHHHVASLLPVEQKEWLEYASEQKISSNELKQALDQANASHKPLPQPKIEWLPEEPRVLPLPTIYSNGTNGTNHLDFESTIANVEPPYLDDSLYRDDEQEPGMPDRRYMITDEEGFEELVTVKDGEELTVVSTKPHVAQNSGNNEWYTPADYIEAARNVLGSIDLDPASNPLANEVVKAETYYTAEDSGLDHEWSGRVWMNPPYAGDLVGKFITKLHASYLSEHVDQAIVLVNNATETAWFQKLTEVTSAICFPRRRVRFWSPTKDEAAPLQGQAVLYLGENTTEFIKTFSSFGLVVSVIDASRL